MKYAFFGSPKFAAIILERLIAAGMFPTIIICNPDRPVGRKQVITPPEVKQLITNYKSPIMVLQPETVQELLTTHYQLLTNLDFFVVAAYAKIIPADVLKLPRLGVIGIHPSLLPKYRGPTPIQTAILDGTEETGATLYLLDEKADHGAILANSKIQITNDKTYGSLEKELAYIGGELLTKTLPKFIAGEIKPKPQDELLATFTRKFKTEDGFIEWEVLKKAQNDGGDIAIKLDRKIRALSHEPGVWVLRPDGKPFGSAQGRRMKLLEAVILEGKLKLKKIQIEGKKEQVVFSFQ